MIKINITTTEKKTFEFDKPIFIKSKSMSCLMFAIYESDRGVRLFKSSFQNGISISTETRFDAYLNDFDDFEFITENEFLLMFTTLKNELIDNVIQSDKVIQSVNAYVLPMDADVTAALDSLKIQTDEGEE